MTCLELASPSLQQLFWCTITQAAGGEAIAAIVMFCVMVYGLYLLKAPIAVSAIVGIFMLYIFVGVPIIDSAGALVGGTGNPLGGIEAFRTMMWIVIVLVGAIIALFFWRLRGR